VNSFINGVKDQFTQGFEIHSPSRWFRDYIGENLALGLGEGFVSEMNKLSTEMVNAVPTSFSATANMRGGTPGRAPAGTGPATSGTIIIKELIVREEADINKIARQLDGLQRIEQRKRGLVPV